MKGKLDKFTDPKLNEIIEKIRKTATARNLETEYEWISGKENVASKLNLKQARIWKQTQIDIDRVLSEETSIIEEDDLLDEWLPDPQNW